ncbi:MAG: porin [Azoarcus sp.]|jgi:predicted porin|nr:porin [Azoarcus sp.]
MQKKLIALAVAGLMSAPAFAQSSVTLYGTLDYGYVFQNRNPGAYDSGTDHVDRVRNRSAIDSGVSKANRLGFKGVEDLGNGLKAVFVYELGLQGDGGAWKGGEARQSYGALAGGFGTVAFGRHYTPQHLFTSAVDPFGKNGLGNAGNVLAQDKRLSNLVAYISPNWSGFSFIAAWTNSYSGNETNENRTPGIATNDARVWAFAPSFTSGGLFLGANVHEAHLSDGQVAGDVYVKHLLAWDLYAAYDFGSVKLGATYGQRRTPLTDGAGKFKVDQALIGATIKASANDKVLVSWAYRKAQAAKILDQRDAKISQVALGYEHALSKRTTLYAQYAYQFQNKAQKNLETGRYADDYGITGYGATGVSNDGGFGGSNYRQGFAVGFRHDF